MSKKTGRGPAWANSLFEDNAEFGLGMFTAMKHRRARLVDLVQDYVHRLDLLPEEGKEENEKVLGSLLVDWLEIKDEKSDKPTLVYDKMKPYFKALLPEDSAVSESKDSEMMCSQDKDALLYKIWSDRDMFPKISQWITGGDGWAYDIGFGGLDHIEAFEANDVNVLVVDTVCLLRPLAHLAAVHLTLSSHPRKCTRIRVVKHRSPPLLERQQSLLLEEKLNERRTLERYS
jgi:pyruvate/2-oxoacid:ferredoxin oxidoreductase beta subunit